MTDVQTILLVEDNPTNLLLFHDVLTAKGYKVIVAKNGYDALEAIGQFLPDLILMDIHLPGLDGLSVIRTIRSSPGFEDIRIIGLSALAMDTDIKEAILAGCDSYLTKPVSISVFIEEVEKQLKIVQGKKQN